MSQPFDPYRAEELLSALADLKDAQRDYVEAKFVCDSIKYIPPDSPSHAEYELKYNKAYGKVSAAQDDMEYAYLRLTSALVPGIITAIKEGDYDV